MERKKILLILVLFLGISLADEVPRYFRDKSLPGKLNIRLWKKNKAMDQPESEDTRPMNTKQTEENDDIEVRHKLPIQDTNGFLPENDVPVTEYCRSKVVEKHFTVISDDRGRTYVPIGKYSETFCDPPPDGDVEMIDDVPHQKCQFKQNSQNYCFTRKEKKRIAYKSTRGRPKLYFSDKEMRSGCRCAEIDVRRKR